MILLILRIIFVSWIVNRIWVRLDESVSIIDCVFIFVMDRGERVINLNVLKMNVYREYLIFVLEIVIEEIKYFLLGNRNFIF